MEDITPWTLWNDLQTNSHSRLSSSKLQNSNPTPVCLDVFTGMFCFCSIKSWTFSSLNKCSAGFSQPWASPAGGGKGPSKQVWSLCSWYPSEINPPKQHSWNTEFNVPLWKVLPHQPCSGDSGQNSCGISVLCSWLPCPGQCHPAEHCRWMGAKGGDPQALPVLLFDTLLLLQSNLHPLLYSCSAPRGHGGGCHKLQALQTSPIWAGDAAV